jgi:hypothetical protein
MHVWFMTSCIYIYISRTRSTHGPVNVLMAFHVYPINHCCIQTYDNQKKMIQVKSYQNLER